MGTLWTEIIKLKYGERDGEQTSRGTDHKGGKKNSKLGLQGQLVVKI